MKQDRQPLNGAAIAYRTPDPARIRFSIRYRRRERMSHFLKFIVNVFLIFAILVAAAILLPPVLGVNTTVVDTSAMDTNLPFGSITYSTTVNVSTLAEGDEVLKENDTSTYAYVINKIGDNGQMTVTNAADESADQETITFRNKVSKVAVTVPFIGYLIIAMHSIEGIVIIALIIVLMIILFILSELWKDRSEDEEEEEDAGAGETAAASEEVSADTAAAGAAASLADGTDKDNDQVLQNMGLDDLTDLSGEPGADETDVSDDDMTIVPDGGADAPALQEEAAAAQEDVPESGAEYPETDEAYEIAPDDSEEHGSAAEDVPMSSLADEAGSSEGGETPARELDKDKDKEETPAGLVETGSSVEEVDPKKEEATADANTAIGESAAAETDDVKTDGNIDLDIPSLERGDDLETQSEAEMPDLEEAIIAQTVEDLASAADDRESDRTIPIDDLDVFGRSVTDETQVIEELPQGETFVPVERATLDEILDQAKKAGEDPDVIKDEGTGVTIVDYSKFV